MTGLKELQGRLNYHFHKQSLLVDALTHPSYGWDRHAPHYQRLEFLGDAVLQLAVSRFLYTHYPSESEGQLTRMRAGLVCEESLNDVAHALKLNGMVRLSVGEARAGGQERPSILSDVVEAIIAAIYLDGGNDAAFDFIYRALEDKLAGGAEEISDAKTHLQELTQKDGGEMPAYELLGVEGPPHLPEFHVCVRLKGEVIGEGRGQSKRVAEQRAAREALRARRR